MANRTPITEDMWPSLRPGEIVVNPISEDEAILGIGRRRRNVLSVISRDEAIVLHDRLEKAFGLSKVRRLKSA